MWPSVRQLRCLPVFLLVPLIESVIVCTVCRGGPIFTLAGVLCAGSSQNGDTLDFDFYTACCSEPWDSAIVPGR